VAPDSAYVFNVAIGDQAIVNARYPGYLRKEPFLAALDLRTGKELWRHNLAVKAAETSEGRLFVLGGTRRGDTIFSLNPKTGKENWKLRLSGDDVWGINTRSAGLSYSKSEPNWAMDSGRIFAVINEKGDKGKSPLVAIDQDTGMILWERAYHKKVRSLIRAAYGKAYIVYGWNFSFGGVPGGDGPWINYWMEKLYAVDGATGRVLWDFGRAVDDFFLVSNGGVFLLNNTQGRLFQESSYFLLDANSGRKLAAHSGYGSFAGKMDEVEVEGEAVFPGLPYRWILKGPDGALWLLSYSPLPRGNEARNHALLMERLN
jgi:outer membrane protein assembly factor BamB